MRVARVTVSVILVIATGWITLGPQPMGEHGWLAVTLDLFRDESGFDVAGVIGVEFLANLGLFVPIGFVLVTFCGTRRWFVALAIAFAITVTIEAAQGMLPGRISDPMDIVANSAGAAVGVSAAMLVSRLRIARDRRARATARRAAAPAA